MFGKYLNVYKLMKHIAKLRQRIKYWQQVGSQAVQDICQRIDKAYKLFFQQVKGGTRPPSFKKTRKYKSFTNWYQAKNHLNRVYEDICHRRKDWFWKLAHDLTNKYDVLIFEDLNLNGMKRLWGRKVSDLSFASFLKILQTVATKKGKVVHFVDKFYPSSKTCSHCGHIHQELNLKDRVWNCPSCNSKGIQRDLNAAINLLREGASSLGLGDVREVQFPVTV